MYLTFKHISPPRLSLNYQNQTRDLSISPFLVIDDNSTKIWKLSSNEFMLLVQAILPCVNCNTPGVYHQLSGGFKIKHDRLVEMTMPKSNLWK
jgi:hypothetical protein